MHIRCPICHAEREAPDDFPSRPFCSPRCKKIDLANWLDEKYCLPRPVAAEDLEELKETGASLGLTEEELLTQLLSRKN